MEAENPTPVHKTYYPPGPRPIVLRVFPGLIKNPLWPLQEFKVRVIKHKLPKEAGVLFDLREFIHSTNRIGFSNKGVSLSIEQVKELRDMLPEIIHYMEVRNKDVLPPKETTTTQGQE